MKKPLLKGDLKGHSEQSEESRFYSTRSFASLRMTLRVRLLRFARNQIVSQLKKDKEPVILSEAKDLVLNSLEQRDSSPSAQNDSFSELRHRLNDRLGFTLMELMLAITLFSIVAVAIYSGLAVGIKVHKKGADIGGGYGELRLAFSRIAQDLRGAIHISNIYLIEESQLVYFFSIQPTQDGTRELYKVTYTWEREKDYFALFHLRETYVDSLQEIHPKGDELLDRLSQLNFDYGYVKKGRRGEEDFQWKEGWKEESMPRLVRLRIERDGEKFNKIVYCPAGKLGEVKE